MSRRRRGLGLGGTGGYPSKNRDCPRAGIVGSDKFRIAYEGKTWVVVVNKCPKMEDSGDEGKGKWKLGACCG